ncbi:hypothetical protein LXA43DRAFT_1096704 [Ganoderma leucocontextum]|nr:hypothetical protein LXA43DRAFT_1096704 [Ganoderma leucocontextum]
MSIATSSPRCSGRSQPRKGSGSSSKGKAVQEKCTNVGYVILLLGGLDESATGTDGRPRFQLLDTAFPGSDLKHALGDAGLIAYPHQTGPRGNEMEALSFSSSWSQVRVDEWLRELFPQFFDYCDLHYGTRLGSDRSDYHWTLVERNRKTITLVRRTDSLTGEDLHRARSTPGRSMSLSCLIFVSRYTIITEIYTDFPRAIDYILNGTIDEFEREANIRSSATSQDEDSEISDIDREGSPLTPLPSPKVKGKGKGKAIMQSSDHNSDRDE